MYEFIHEICIDICYVKALLASLKSDLKTTRCPLAKSDNSVLFFMITNQGTF